MQPNSDRHRVAKAWSKRILSSVVSQVTNQLMANSSFDKIGITTDSMGLCYDNSAKQVLLSNFPSMIEFPHACAVAVPCIELGVTLTQRGGFGASRPIVGPCVRSCSAMVISRELRAPIGWRNDWRRIMGDQLVNTFD